MSLSLFSAGHLLLGTQPPLRVVVSPERLPWRELSFHLQVVIN